MGSGVGVGVLFILCKQPLLPPTPFAAVSSDPSFCSGSGSLGVVRSRGIYWVGSGVRNVVRNVVMVGVRIMSGVRSGVRLGRGSLG